jgi:hypothetical protein
MSLAPCWVRRSGHWSPPTEPVIGVLPVDHTPYTHPPHMTTPAIGPQMAIDTLMKEHR